MKREEQIIKDIRELVDKYWSFDNNQIHTHSWHDKQDCLEQIDRYLADHPTEQKKSCDNCGWQCIHTDECLCPENCDEITDHWKPIEPVVQEIGITEKSCDNCDPMHPVAYCMRCNDDFSHWKPQTK